MSEGERFVISIEGSLISSKKGLSFEFCKKLNSFVRNSLRKNPNLHFFIIVGGGNLSERYRNVGRKILGQELDNNDIDWLGIHSTRLNAHLVKTIFSDIAHPYILKNYEIIRRIKEPVVVAAGWKSKLSIDFCSMIICEDYEIKNIIRLKDSYNYRELNILKPQNFLTKLSWEEYQKMNKGKLRSKPNISFDKAVVEKAKEIGVSMVLLDGNDFKNIESYFNEKKYKGTIITNSNTAS